MTMPLESENRQGRCMALYPGAFRPPHAAHFAAVRALLDRPAIDEVVVIISNRCRPIPGTTYVLDAALALRVWALYLEGIERVRVEVAPCTAIRHALEYFHRVPPGSTLYFCLGEADFASGDPRFQTIAQFAERTGIAAQIVPAPTGAMTIRGTNMRAALGRGEAGRSAFLAALPGHLTEAQQAAVWEWCRAGMKGMSEVIAPKVRAVLERHGLNSGAPIYPVRAGKLDPVFRTRWTNGQPIIVKYAGDTADAGHVGRPDHLKPRKRLAVERRVLSMLTASDRERVQLPEVVLFEKATWTLAISEICPGGHALAQELARGRFDPSVARTASRFLAQCHSLTHGIPPLWGDEQHDRDHWERMLAWRTICATDDGDSDALRQALEQLREASRLACGPGLMHLDFGAHNILVGHDAIGVIDWELSSSVGDPAYDFGWFVGQYLLWAHLTASGSACREAVTAAIESYRRVIGNRWSDIATRTTAFAGAAMLAGLNASQIRVHRPGGRDALDTATWLLTERHKDCEWSLIRALTVDPPMGLE